MALSEKIITTIGSAYYILRICIQQSNFITQLLVFNTTNTAIDLSKDDLCTVED